MNGNWMERRTMSKSNGFSVPERCTFSLKLVPTCPRSISLTSWLFFPARSFPSISIKISPAFRPTSAAGIFSYGSDIMERFSFGFQVITEPIPP